MPFAHLVRDHTIYACVMGSRAFGLATDGSDTDRRGVFLAPTPLFWRFEKPPTHIEGPAEEQFSWELERFCELALRANPQHPGVPALAPRRARRLHGPRTPRPARGVPLPPGPRDVHALRVGPAEEAGGRHPRARRAPLEARDAPPPPPDERPRPAPHGHPDDRRRRPTRAAPRGETRRGPLAGGRVLDDPPGHGDGRGSHGLPLPPEPDRARVEDFLLRVRRASADALVG